MNLISVPLPKPRFIWRYIAAALILGASPVAASAQMRDEGAGRILRAMSEYIGSQKNISFSYNSDIEVVTSSYTGVAPEIETLHAIF